MMLTLILYILEELFSVKKGGNVVSDYDVTGGTLRHRRMYIKEGRTRTIGEEIKKMNEV